MKLIFIGLLLVLGFVIACGTAAPVPGTSVPEAAPAQSTSPPQGQATAIPAPTAPPAAVEISGTVTIMQAVWGNQLFDTRDASGEVRRYGQLVHGYWVGSNENVELIPGIAESWELSDDGLTWSFVIRGGRQVP